MITVREDIAKLQETISGEDTGITAQISALQDALDALEERVAALETPSVEETTPEAT